MSLVPPAENDSSTTAYRGPIVPSDLRTRVVSMSCHSPWASFARCGAVPCFRVYVPSGFAKVCEYSVRSAVTSTGSPDAAARSDGV